MPEDYEMEEIADCAVEESREFIDVEQQFVNKEHDLYSALLGWHNIVGHLTERIPEDMPHLHELNGKIAEKIEEITKLIYQGRLHDSRFIKEEEQILQQLEQDIKHRDWRAVRTDIAEEKAEEKKAIRLEHHELKELHSKFAELAALMQKSSLKLAIEQDSASAKEKEEFEKLEEYYFLQIYKFTRAYEIIFRHLWKKELILARKLKI